MARRAAPDRRYRPGARSGSAPAVSTPPRPAGRRARRGGTARRPQAAAERRAERTALIEELKKATGLGGRPRRSGSPAEKARVNVTRTIRHAMRELASRAPDLAAHLEESIVTGVTCCYEPRVDIVWAT